MVMPTSLASFTKLVCSMVNYINKIDHFTNSDGDRSNGFETILRYPYCTEHKNTGTNPVSGTHQYSVELNELCTLLDPILYSAHIVKIDSNSIRLSPSIFVKRSILFVKMALNRCAV